MEEIVNGCLNISWTITKLDSVHIKSCASSCYVDKNDFMLFLVRHFIPFALRHSKMLWSLWQSEIHPYTSSSFRIEINKMFLDSCNACNIRMWLRQQFFTYWKDNNIPNIKKQTRRTDRSDRLRWISLTLFRKSVCCCLTSICNIRMYAIFIMRINQVQVWINYDTECLPKRIWAEIVYHQL